VELASAQEDFTSVSEILQQALSEFFARRDLTASMDKKKK
jgi:hypothetical protein